MDHVSDFVNDLDLVRREYNSITETKDEYFFKSDDIGPIFDYLGGVDFTPLLPRGKRV